MAGSILRLAVAAEQDDALHMARLLLLLRHAAGKGDGSVNGIMKLAKLDFLCRYPVYLQRLLNEHRARPPIVPFQIYEESTVESRMIRFRYGPWDPRYRRWIGLSVSLGLSDAYLTGRTVHVSLTNRGLDTAKEIADSECFTDLDARAALILKVAGSWSGTKLKDAIYRAVPELAGLKWGEEIG